MVILLLTPVAVNTQEIDLAKIKPLIVGAAEELRKVSIRSELSAGEYQDIMDISCNALTELSQDEDFEHLLREYEKRQYDEKLAGEIREIFLNFRSFLEFMVVERDLLLDAGFSEVAVNDILAQLMKVRLEAVGFKLDAETLLMDLRRLAEQICSASEHVSDNVESAEMICNIERIAPFIFGAAAIAVDGISFLVPIGITQAVAAASIAGGSVLMGAAAMMPQC
jgi:hypothetical protein